MTKRKRNRIPSENVLAKENSIPNSVKNLLSWKRTPYICLARDDSVIVRYEREINSNKDLLKARRKQFGVE